MKELLSNCCSASVHGELSNNISGKLEGRCNDCKEMASFEGLIEVQFINSEFPLGTTDGLTYTVYPQV